MGTEYKFSVIKFEAHPVRDEKLNVGIAVVRNRELDVRLTKKLTKLQSISAALDLDALRESLLDLPQLYEFILGECSSKDFDVIGELSKFATCNLVPGGKFVAQTDAEYEFRVNRLLSDIVEPEKGRLVRRTKRRSKVKSKIERRLKDIGILGKQGDSLESHRIIPNHEITDGVEADLLLRNGSYHVLETVDIIQDSATSDKVFKEVGKTTIVFENAKMIYGRDQTVPRLIYQASAELEDKAAPALAALNHQGIELVNWESQADRDRLVEILANLVLQDDKKSNSEQWVDASVKNKLELN